MWGRKAREIHRLRLCLEVAERTSRHWREDYRAKCDHESLTRSLADKRVADAAAQLVRRDSFIRWLSRRSLLLRFREGEDNRRDAVLREVEAYLVAQAEVKKGNATLLARVRAALPGRG